MSLKCPYSLHSEIMACQFYVPIIVSLIIILTSNFQIVHSSYNKLLPYSQNKQKNEVLNIIDSCWRGKMDWESTRQALADCAVGFGKNALGGKGGPIYVVTDPGDDAQNPQPGTLRYGAIQDNPLWITFSGDMTIILKSELIMNSYKTIDGRGAKVEIANGPCITIQYVKNVIIHGVSIHDCKPGVPGLVRSTPSHLGHRDGSEGDAITIFGSTDIWIDHCFLSNSADGLIDVVKASNGVTISNNYLTKHDHVMLFGHNDNNDEDKIMKVTVVYNHFGPGLVQRMPRVRFGYAHVANNQYDQWLLYAIGGSADPTILSEGNYFTASDDPYTKQVTKRDNGTTGSANWNWRSTKDVFMNGAYFVPSGNGTCDASYSTLEAFDVADGSTVPTLTASAGPLNCAINTAC